MPLENILETIEQNKKAELQRIEEEYAARFQAVDMESEEEIKRLLAEYASKRQSETNAIESSGISAAEIEARSILRDRKGALIEEGLNQAFNTLEDLPGTDEYGSILEEMVACAKRLLGRNCIIRARKADLPLLEGKKGIKVVEEEVDPYGGILCTSSDGTKEVDLTISTLKNELREALALAISERLGED
ncbi:MAG: V-type ATP synthase subunit E family protein [Methanomassiliicoccales archaeon]